MDNGIAAVKRLERVPLNILRRLSVSTSTGIRVYENGRVIPYE